MKTYHVNKEGYYGEFGGAYIPEILHRCVEELQNAEGGDIPADIYGESLDCRMPIPKYWKVKDSNKNSTSYYATM